MLWDSWWNVWRGRSLPQRRRAASGASLMRAADVAGAWTTQQVEPLEDRRLLSAGDLDSTFGNSGKATIENAGHANGLALQSDGKIVVAGGSYFSQSTVARYTTDGSLDTTFDLDGKVTTNFGGSITCVAIQSDGKIVIGGGTFDFTVARYNSDGTLDTAFGAGGRQTTDFAGLSDQPTALVIQNDGKIVVVGWSGTAGHGGNTDFAMARYNIDGSLDSTFGIGGKVTTDFGTLGDVAKGVAVDASTASAYQSC